MVNEVHLSESKISDNKTSNFSVALGFLQGVLIATVMGCIAQTQINLAALINLGAEIPPALRLDVTIQDLLGFGPVYFAMVFIAFIPALLFAHFLARRWPHLHYLIFVFAGALSLLLTFKLADAFAPMPTLIAATRDIFGTLLMMTGGALGGWFFARAYRRGDVC
jgi:hypothetical protein